MKIRRIYAIVVGLFFAASVAFASGARLFTETNSHINQIIQDHLGYIWMATDNGLTRYDGSTVKTFTRTAGTPSLLNNIVLSVLEDSKGDIWVGTHDGIQKFDRSTETFVTPRLNYPSAPEFTYVNSIIEDSRGDLWFTTSRSGVISFQGPELEPKCFLTSNSAICSDKTSVVFEDKFGNIWIGTHDAGISVYNPSNGTMTNYRHDPNDASTLSGNMIFSIVQLNDRRLLIASLDGGIDSFDYNTHRFTRRVIDTPGSPYVLRYIPESNIVYIGTDGNGIYEYDLKTHSLRSIEPIVTEFDLSHSKIHDIVLADDGNLWAAVYQKGALQISTTSGNAGGIENLGFNPFRPSQSIGTEPVLSILKSRDGNLWIGTDGDGIYRGRVASNGTPSDLVQINTGITANASVLCIFQDSRGDIWAGCYLKGLSKYNPAQGCFVPFALKDLNGNPLKIKGVNTIKEDNSGRLWIGTDGNGVCVTDPATGISRVLRQESSAICGNTIHAICFDHNANAWIGTSDAGLTRYNPNDSTSDHFNLSNRRLLNNCVYGLLEDANGNIWVATAGGLAAISRDGTTRFFNEASGLSSSMPYALLSDNKNCLWMSSQDGIHRFDVGDETFSEISRNELRCREFKRGAAFADADGVLWFGGVGGMVRIDPSKIATEAVKAPRLCFTELSYRDNETGKVKTVPLYGLSSINLDHESNTLTFGFSTIEYNHADEVVYSVRLDGYHDGWQALPRGVYSYTLADLPPGDYKMMVRAEMPGATTVSDIDFGISIQPPFWLTWWAKTIYVIAVIALVAGVFILVLSIKRRRYRERLKSHEESLMEAKLQFFTDVSHDIRTPLSLILAPIAGLKKKAPDQATRRTYDMMEANGARILRMISQIIDLRKFDNRRMNLDVAPTDIRQFLSLVAASFVIAVKDKQIDFGFTVAEDVPEKVWLDTDKADKVLFNVVSNAMRFTPEGGRVWINADIDGGGRLRIRVSDTGAGMPADQFEAIFERFYQIKGKERRGGTGIGLHLSRKMMEAHHGSIFVESSGPEGTVFTITFPIDEASYSPDERTETPVLTAPVQPSEPDKPVSSSKSYYTTPKAYTVLIVEDDESIRDYLSECLGSNYNISTAPDGEKGLEAALRLRPHCIITDIMMPGVDGLELCRKIRANHEICDIPVVMLTARAADAQRLEGIEAGADSYITKPFNVEHLLTQVAMLIHSRRMIKKKFSDAEQVNPEVAAMKSGDEKLMEKVEAAVIKELANPDLSVEYIASAIGVSRSNLHRRLKVLTNMSPSAYIKQARMRHAAHLLVEKKLAVSEVAYATGFSSLSHFSTVFREYYGMSPTRYVATNSEGRGQI